MKKTALRQILAFISMNTWHHQKGLPSNLISPLILVGKDREMIHKRLVKKLMEWVPGNVPSIATLTL